MLSYNFNHVPLSVLSKYFTSVKHVFFQERIMQIIHQLAPQSVAKHGVPRKKDETLSDVPLDEVVYNEQIMNYAVSAQRDVCGKCSKSIKLYCCKCSLASILCGPLPSVKLPVPLIMYVCNCTIANSP
jgi:hypothetical protein